MPPLLPTRVLLFTCAYSAVPEPIDATDTPSQGGSIFSRGKSSTRRDASNKSRSTIQFHKAVVDRADMGIQKPKMLTNTIDPARGKRCRAELDERIGRVLNDPRGLPSGRGRRDKLNYAQMCELKSELIHAFEHAAVLASNGRLPNLMQGRGAPPDNAILIFIDDIMRACEAAGLKPGLRYMDPASLPVLIFNELGPLLWPVGKCPRRLFERWQRNPIVRNK